MTVQAGNVLDLVGTQIVGFLMHRLNCNMFPFFRFRCDNGDGNRSNFLSGSNRICNLFHIAAEVGFILY